MNFTINLTNDTNVMIAKYISLCKELSLTARVSIALKVFDSYCNKNALTHRLIDEFKEYMWRFMIVFKTEEFSLWESSKPPLVYYGLGDELEDGDLLALKYSKFSDNQGWGNSK